MSAPGPQRRLPTGTTEGRHCAGCGIVLAADNTARLCGRCHREQTDQLSKPPQLRDEFFETNEFRAAFESRHIGKVFKVYRNHPRHLKMFGKALNQELLGRWLGLNQPQVSKIENAGSPEQNVKVLQGYAEVLHLPQHLLWFDLPDQSRRKPQQSSRATDNLIVPTFPELGDTVVDMSGGSRLSSEDSSLFWAQLGPLIDMMQNARSLAGDGAYEELMAVLRSWMDNVRRRSILRAFGSTALAVAGSSFIGDLATDKAINGDVAQEYAASVSGGDPEPLTRVQTTYAVDRAIAAVVDVSTKKTLLRWTVDLDDPIARVNATGILAKIPGQRESDRVSAILHNDDEVRRLYLTAVTMRVCSIDWDQAAKFVQNPTGFPFVSLVAEQFAREVVNPADAGARWCSAKMLQDLSPAIGR